MDSSSVRAFLAGCFFMGTSVPLTLLPDNEEDRKQVSNLCLMFPMMGLGLGTATNDKLLLFGSLGAVCTNVGLRYLRLKPR